MSKNQAIQKLLHKSGLCIRKYSPVALSCVASAGVVVTAIAAAKATPRAVALVYADSRKKHDEDSLLGVQDREKIMNKLSKYHKAMRSEEHTSELQSR